MVDVISFIRKVEVPQISSMQEEKSSFSKNYRVIIGIEKAKNL